jgi:hypothetical protein
LSTEQTGYRLLKQILQKLTRLMDEGRLKLKADKARKAKQLSIDVLKRDVLAGIYKRCADVAAREKQLLNSAKLDEIRCNIALFQEQVRQLKARKLSVVANEAIKEQAYNETLERIRNHKNAIEKNIYSSLSEKVQII